VQFLFRSLVADPKAVAAVPDWASFVEVFGRDKVDAAQDRYERLLGRWAEIHGLQRAELQQITDIEDWIENAIKLVAAVDTGLPVYTIRRTPPGEPLKIAAKLNTDADFDGNVPTAFLGTILRWDPCFSGESGINFVWPSNGHLGASDYWNDETLMRALGRPAAVASGDPDGERGYVATTLGLRAAGASDLMAKIVFQVKYQAPARLSLPPDSDERDVRNAFYTAFEDNLLDCEARDQCFLIQECRPMLHEYRVIVVGGKPVAGAGTVEWLNPIFHDPDDGSFDPFVEGKRGDRDLVCDRDLVARYVDRAARLCAELETRGSKRFRNCTMDFAFDEQKGDVLLIETNPCDNFGLYALDFSPVIDGMVADCRAAIPASEPLLTAEP
jgi:hypothetical protein